MMSLTFGLLTQVSGSGPLGPFFCDITNSCPFSYYSTLTARADLFL